MSENDGHKIELFEYTHFLGKRTELYLTNCSNVPASVVNTISSIKTHGRCARLYDQPDCLGNTIKISARGPFLQNLKEWGFDKKVQSVELCESPCLPEEITLYEMPYWRGKEHPFKISGCTIIKEKKYRMRDTFKSVSIPEGGCVLLYMGISDDEAKDCLVEDEKRVQEFRNGTRGTPFLHDLKGFVYDPKEFVKAISPCECKYRDNNTFLEIPENPDNSTEIPENPDNSTEISEIPDNSTEIPENLDNSTGILEYIKLYHLPNFFGNFLQIPLNFKGCRNFSSFAADQSFQAVAQSIWVSNGSCAQLYRAKDCTGSVSLHLTEPVANLREFNFDSAISSFSRCAWDWDKPKPEEPVATTTGGYVQEPHAHEEINGSTSLTFYLVPLVGVSLLVSAVLAGILIRMKWQNRQITETSTLDKLSEKEINEFTHALGLGLGDAGVPGRERTIENEYGNGNCNDNDRPESLKFSSDLLAQNQPYNFQLELSKSLLKFDSRFPIGAGEFGRVFKGTMRHGSDDTFPVAIKTTHTSSNAHCLRALLKEVKVMMYVGQHPKIVTLIGCCTLNLREGELLIAMEYCEHGSLEAFLKTNRNKFINFVQKGKLNVPKLLPTPEEYYIFNSENTTDYISVKDESGMKSQGGIEMQFNINQLILWSIEIVEGMEYLASKRVIHGDLSARNILLISNYTTKISDFGLPRKMYCYSQYTRNGNDPLPWRWLALESLKNLEFSSVSDVWSYGILLWEIFTLGEQPYPGMASLTNNLVLNLEQGVRPTIPQFATSDCYNIMASCWDENPQRRPTFSQLFTSLKVVQDACLDRKELCLGSS